MSELIDTTEMYLRTIYELYEEGIEPLRARIVERLEQSGPTVSQTVGRLERDGLVVVRNNRQIEFTDEGWNRAQRVMRRHRIAECLLLDVLKIQWSYAHDEACRLEHVVSDLLDEKITELLDDPKVSPYGAPIPPFEARVDPNRFRKDVVNALDHIGKAPVTLHLVRISEGAQDDAPALSALEAIGVRPGADFEAFQVNSADVQVTGPEGVVRVAREIAAGLWVTPLSTE